MKIDIPHNVKDKFFYLKDGKIYKAAIVEIISRESIYNRNSVFNAECNEPTLSEITYKFHYKVLLSNGNISIQNGSTRSAETLYKTKEDAAKALLRSAGFEPGLDSLL